MEKYLNYEGLVKFKEELEKLRLADKLEITLALNSVSGDIGNGTITVKRNNVTVGTFSVNQKTNDEFNISVPTSISDLGLTAITEILNLINYGLLDVSELTEELKEALHNQTAESSGFVSEDALSTELAVYGKTIDYDSTRKMIQLKNGNTVLSEFSAQDFITDGMVEDVRITNGTGDNAGKTVLLIDFNTESGITDIEIPLELIFNANNYYTKTEIDNAGFLTQHQDISGKANSADLATVATSGSYNDLSNKPTIPAAQIQSDWNQTDNTAKDFIKNKPTIVPAEVEIVADDTATIAADTKIVIEEDTDGLDTLIYTQAQTDNKIATEIEAAKEVAIVNNTTPASSVKMFIDEAANASVELYSKTQIDAMIANIYLILINNGLTV